MSEARYEIGESPEPEAKPRKVTLVESENPSGTVRVKVNGVVVAAFCAGDDHLEIFNPETEITGLAVGAGGHLLKVK